MSEKILHSIEFVERYKYINQKYPENIHAVSESVTIPEPRVGEYVTFGWFEDEETGERVEIVDFDWTGVDYQRSQSIRGG